MTRCFQATYKERVIFALCFAVIAFSSYFILSPDNRACAGTFSDTSCDPNYYDSLEARAWLEAQREITQNQNLIFKPDSVLEYSCFDSHIAQMIESADNLFSQSSTWGSVGGNMGNAMQSVHATAGAYITSNFNHNYLGGRHSSGTTWPANASKGGYTCPVMETIWLQAKCLDFIHQPGHDGFFTFADYHSREDMRRLPASCGATVANAFGQGGGKHTADFFRNMARATGGDLDNNGTTDAGEGTSWAEDDIKTYFYLFNRGNNNSNPPVTDVCGNNINANNGQSHRSKIQTGLIVENTTGKPSFYNEYICLVPGCYYHPRGTGTRAAPSNAGRCCRPGEGTNGCPALK